MEIVRTQDYPQGQLEKSKVITFVREECLTKVVSDHYSLLQILSWYLLSSPIRHFRNEKVTGAEMLPAIILSTVTGDALVSYWPIFFLSLVTIPEVFAKVNSAQFPLVSKVANSQKNNFFLSLRSRWAGRQGSARGKLFITIPVLLSCPICFS